MGYECDFGNGENMLLNLFTFANMKSPLKYLSYKSHLNRVHEHEI